MYVKEKKELTKVWLDFSHRKLYSKFVNLYIMFEILNPAVISVLQRIFWTGRLDWIGFLPTATGELLYENEYSLLSLFLPKLISSI